MALTVTDVLVADVGLVVVIIVVVNLAKVVPIDVVNRRGSGNLAIDVVVISF